MKKIPVFIPYTDNREEELLIQCVRSGWVAQGQKVVEFEKMVALHEKVRYGVATTSCTTALHLLYMAMGLCKNHEILIPSFTFVATANAAEYLGATVVLVDVLTSTYCINPTAVKKIIEERYKKNSKGKLISNVTGKELFGIVAVHLFGVCADMPAINAIAKEYSIHVVEDSACALGSQIDNISEGGFGNPTCLSFHARKSITTGEGGMVLTNSPELEKTMRRLRSHGASISEVDRHHAHEFLLPEYNELGFNYRMTDLQASMGIAQMEKFSWIVEQKSKIANYYNEKLIKEVQGIIPPFVPDGYLHTYQSYVTMVDVDYFKFDTVEKGNEFRNKLMRYLENNGISTRQGTHAIHLLGYYKKKYNYAPSALPQSYACDRLSIAIPLYVGLSLNDQSYIIYHLKKGIDFILSSQ